MNALSLFLQAVESEAAERGTDADADIFITATGITNSTIIAAIRALVSGLKSNSLWGKCAAIYPMVGGTASAHKYNLKNPVDSDAAYRLTFTAGWTHSATGAKPNGSSASASTHLNASALSTASAHLSYYARNAATTGDPAEIGAFTSISEAIVLQSKGEGSALRYFYNYNNRATYNVGGGGASGFLLGSSTATTQRDIYLNGASYANNTTTDTSTLPNYPIYLGAANISNSSSGSYTDAECAFATIGTGLTAAESANLYSIVQSFNTSLSRNI